MIEIGDGVLAGEGIEELNRHGLLLASSIVERAFELTLEIEEFDAVRVGLGSLGPRGAAAARSLLSQLYDHTTSPLNVIARHEAKLRRQGHGDFYRVAEGDGTGGLVPPVELHVKSMSPPRERWVDKNHRRRRRVRRTASTRNLRNSECGR
jgi:hypothetical protein